MWFLILCGFCSQDIPNACTAGTVAVRKTCYLDIPNLLRAIAALTRQHWWCQFWQPFMPTNLREHIALLLE